LNTERKETIHDGLIILAVFALIVVAIVGMILAINYGSLPGELAQIEQLRSDARKVRDPNSEDVVGQIAEVNRTIASNKKYNRMWWSAWAIPDAWDDVQLIEVPGGPTP
jgi:hypothetical protein